MCEVLKGTFLVDICLKGWSLWFHDAQPEMNWGEDTKSTQFHKEDEGPQ